MSAKYEFFYLDKSIIIYGRPVQGNLITLHSTENYVSPGTNITRGVSAEKEKG